jgi:O-antigen/teichoic acid export membrane protein
MKGERVATPSAPDGSPPPLTGWRRIRARVLADETLSQKATLNMVASILDYGARIVVGFLLNPILVSRLGDLVFGVYQVLGRFIGYATPAGGRPSQALKWTIARHQYSTAYEEKRLQVGSALAVWLLFLPVLLVAGGVLAWFAPLVLDVPDNLVLTVRIAAALLVADLVLVNLLTIPQSVVQGENLGYKRMGLSMLVVFFGGALAAAAAIGGAGLVGVTASVVATTILTGLLFLWVARRHVRWFGAERPSLRLVVSFVRLSAWFLLWNFVMQLMRGSDVVVLGIADSAEAVTTYALSRYVPEAMFGAVAIVVSAIMPGLGGVIGASDLRRAATVRSESMTATWLLTTAAGATFVLWQESFLALWVGREYYPGATATLLIILMITQFAFIRNDASIIDLTLELRGKVLLGLVSAALSIALGFLFVGAWDLGIAGVAAAFIAGWSILSVAYPWFVLRTLEVPLLGQALAAIRPLAFAALTFAAAVVLAPHLEVGSWLALVLVVSVSFGVLALASFTLGLTRGQRERVSSRVRQIVGR